MRPLALTISTSPVTREVLEAAGWDVLDPARKPASPDLEPRQVELWVVGLDADGFAQEVTKLARIKQSAPDLRMVVVAPFLNNPGGPALTAVLLDVPIIRCGFERQLLLQAVAAA